MVERGNKTIWFIGDGGEKVISRVRHVSGIKRNLVSPGMLEEFGCSYKVENDVLKVIKGVMVFMKSNIDHGIYILKGNNITVLVATVITKNDKTILWIQ